MPMHRPTLAPVVRLESLKPILRSLLHETLYNYIEFHETDVSIDTKM